MRIYWTLKKRQKLKEYITNGRSINNIAQEMNSSFYTIKKQVLQGLDEHSRKTKNYHNYQIKLSYLNEIKTLIDPEGYNKYLKCVENNDDNKVRLETDNNILNPSI